MTDNRTRRAPMLAGRPMASSVTLFTADLMAVASVLDREQYQAFVMMCVDFQTHGAEPRGEAVEGFEDAYRWFRLLKPYAEGVRNYRLTQDAKELNEGRTVAELFGEQIAEWFEG